MTDVSNIIREPSEKEDTIFREAPDVAAMATADNRVIINPYSGLSSEEQEAAMLTESARVVMRTAKGLPHFQLTEEQMSAVSEGDYKYNIRAAKEDLVTKMLFGDPDAGVPTEEQAEFIRALRERMFGVT